MGFRWIESWTRKFSFSIWNIKFLFRNHILFKFESLIDLRLTIKLPNAFSQKFIKNFNLKIQN